MSIASTATRRALQALAAEPIPVRISGRCMTPHLTEGAYVYVRASRWYWPGDVVVFHAWDGGWLVHRIIGGYPRRRGWRWLTQADRAARPDASVPSDRVLGKLCGGECAQRLISIPLRDRLWAVSRYITFAFLHALHWEQDPR